MTTLLVLGSKPEPVLPATSIVDEVACANASGASAAKHGLPQPSLTVMSAILTSGKKAPNRLALEALKGLRTGTLYFYPRPRPKGGALRRIVGHLRNWRTGPVYFRWKLRRLGFRFDRFEARTLDGYHKLIEDLTDHDEGIARMIADKQPSSGIMALIVGIEKGCYSRYVMSGFSFEITHAYAQNPLIAELGTTKSKHADTDIAVLHYLSQKYRNIYTTEPTVNARAGVPLLDESSASHAAG